MPLTPMTVTADEGSSFVLAPDQPQTLTFHIPDSGSPNRMWASAIITARVDENDSLVVRGSYLNPPDGSDPPHLFDLSPGETVSGDAVFQYPYGVITTGQTDVYDNVVLTLTPYRPPQAYADAGYATDHTFLVCRNATYIQEWYVYDVASATVIDSNGVSYSVTVPDDPPGQLGQIALPPQTATGDVSYTLTATGKGGETVTSTATYQLIPFSVTLDIEPNPVVFGHFVKLTWSSIGADSVTIYVSTPPITQSMGGTLRPSGSFIFDPLHPPYINRNIPGANPAVFTATAHSSGSCGTTSVSVTVPVIYETDSSNAPVKIKVSKSRCSPLALGGGNLPTVKKAIRQQTMAQDVATGRITVIRAAPDGAGGHRLQAEVREGWQNLAGGATRIAQNILGPDGAPVSGQYPHLWKVSEEGVASVVYLDGNGKVVRAESRDGLYTLSAPVS